MGKNVTDKANCRQNGFHCAEDPLDCLSYYSDIHRAVFCLVDAGGDIDEDDCDSKISCTELTILKELTLDEYKAVCPMFENDVYDAIDLHNCVSRRDIPGGPGLTSVGVQLETLDKFIKEKNA